jgi:rod shape determining protein RodA
MVDYVDTRQAAKRRRRATRLPREHGGSVLRRLDWVLFLTAVALVGYGLWAIAGITEHDIPGDPDYYLLRQVVFVFVGSVLMAVAVFIDPEWYRRAKSAIYVAMIALMVLVFVVAEATRGSKRWIDVSFFRFQPSEFGKLLFVLFVAAFLADRGKKIAQLRTPVLAVLLAVPPILLVFLQPDLGSGLVYSAGLAACLFIAGTRWLHLGLLAGLALTVLLAVLWLLPAAGAPVLKDYQADRLTSFTNPDEDPRGATYNARQSITAVGAGGATGRGVDGATQTSLNYLPEHATDFAFASLAEQRGFVGVMILLLLYLLVVWRGLKIVAIARDAFSAIAAAGIVVAFLFQVFVNVGMTIGVAPVTGIPLPFVSVGGSSLVANLAAIGVLEAIHARGRLRRA